ncbi:N-acetylglucosamine-6-phosphate deacetylase [Boudabousia marimammalium]|uniref:N-acetylglucosamine-6-phosphate deacetylase n=1 Tax=Boudabousia marimammalium TaxID=156892 RepID=A0A1Q5PRG2_9ACTO|nr:amidohydrolase family protein [Boudabousia marimammalium]OKL50157.1 N-acetylglucosamine-6-phosphate deacetylase [Boudabousia marimammalium]
MSEQIILRGSVVTPDAVIEDGVVSFVGDTLTFVGPAAEASFDLSGAETIDGYILPGLVDVHCHGGGGASFPDAETHDDVRTAVMEHRRHGTTTMVGSCVTAAPDVLKRRAQLMADVCDEGELAGIHFEGPFVSKERCGAQDPRFIIDPDPQLTKELIEAGRGHVKTMTIAPEKPNILGREGVNGVLISGRALPSFGHSDSAPEDARAALEDARQLLDNEPNRLSGRATITHLFNGMRPIHHRDPGPIMEFIADATKGGAIVEMIGDGIHLNFNIIRDVYELVGRENMVFVTDAMAAAGMADGEYVLGPQAVRVKDGVARLAGGDSIAGGTSHLMDQVKKLVDFGMPIVDMVYCASVQGAAILNDGTIGSLTVGKRADLVVTTPELDCVKVYRRGQLVK